MAATAVVPTITKLPPGPERRELHYSNRLHIQPRFPVSAEFHAGGEASSTGVDFSDFTRMSVRQHKQSGERRLPTPVWALNDDLLRKVLVAYMESRAGIQYPYGSEQERLIRAQQRLLEKRPALIATMRKLCSEYVALKQSAGPDDKRLKKLQIQISNLDTVRRFSDSNLAATVLAVVHAYHRRCVDSVTTAAEFNTRPPHIRQLLWRLARTYDRLENGWVRPCGGRGPSSLDVASAARLWFAGKNLKEISKTLGCDSDTVRKVLVGEGLYKVRHRCPNKPKSRTIAEHVALLEKLAAHNGGRIPTRTWLNDHRFWCSYEAMRKNPGAFAHLEREFQRPRKGKRQAA